MKVSRIYATWIYVKDFEESRNFYQKVLGFRPKYQEDKWLEFDLGGTTFGIFERPKEKGKLKPQKTRIMFQVDEIESFKEHLKKNNVKLIGDVRNESYGKLLTFEDPNGHWLELFQPK